MDRIEERRGGFFLILVRPRTLGLPILLILLILFYPVHPVKTLRTSTMKETGVGL